MGDGARSGFFFEETAESKMLGAFVHHIIVSGLKEYTLGIRLGNFR
jgi:hypothetical protein